MISAALITKKIPTVLPAITGAVASAENGLIDPITLSAVGFGLLAGALWRVGDMAGDRKPWREMRSDLIASALTGLANAIVAIALTEYITNFINGGVLVALGVGTITGASGRDMINWIKSAAKDKITKQ